jgi:predicted NBD/HSP70 family sugar kinase
MDVLVVDIGGSHVKMLASGQHEPRKFDSSEDLTPQVLVEKVRESTADWKFEVISIGYPGAVDARGPRAEPGNLGNGWVRFDFSKAFDKPVRVLNDAAMQALGGYDGGRMLFIGLGTGVGSALVTEHVVVPLELGCLAYCPTETMFDRLGAAGLESYGEASWLASVTQATTMLRDAFAADYVLIGGGNSSRVQPLPPGARCGGNEDAFTGGFRLWEETVEPHDRSASSAWRVVR